MDLGDEHLIDLFHEPIGLLNVLVLRVSDMVDRILRVGFEMLYARHGSFVSRGTRGVGRIALEPQRSRIDDIAF